MGPDLAAALPRFRALCAVKAIGTIDAAVRARGPAFAGLTATWAQQPRMRASLLTNDSAAMPGYTLHEPALIAQGTADPFVLEALQTPFVRGPRAAGAPVTYRLCPGADRFSVMHRADADVLAFLRGRFGE